MENRDNMEVTSTINTSKSDDDFVNKTFSSDSDNSGDEAPISARPKKKIQQFSDSDGESMQKMDSDSEERKNTEEDAFSEDCGDNGPKNIYEKQSHEIPNDSSKKIIDQSSDSDEDSKDKNEVTNNSSESESGNLSFKITKKTRLRKIGSDSESDSAPEDSTQESRIKSKQNKLKQKFQNLLTSRSKESHTNIEKIKAKSTNFCDDEKRSDSSENSEDEETGISIEKMKQTIKEQTMQLKSSLYDPDTSDDEKEEIQVKEAPKQKKARKSTKLTSPKPQRMSAKEAMENMQKIKSESNRLLRESDVSLPYHRPKALSLKDIMSRRKPAVAADGKALPIKMNEEQLKHYVQLLEQRQKEMIELCKSESEEEEEIAKSNENTEGAEMSINNDSLYDDLSTQKSKEIAVTSASLTEKSTTENILDNLISSETNTVVKEDNASETANKVDPEPMLIDFDDSEQKEIVETENTSADTELVYNDSVEESYDNQIKMSANGFDLENTKHPTDPTLKTDTEVESQLISLHYENTEHNSNCEKVEVANVDLESRKVQDCEHVDVNDCSENKNEDNENNEFSDSDLNMDDIDALIENAEITASQGQDIAQNVNSPMLVKDLKPVNLKSKPTLTGAPGMVIDLDGTDPMLPKKLSGIELLKERFTYFARIKTPEELEREKEKRIKPGTQHLKLKQKLEDQIAEQRSLEWAKRLAEEKQQKEELDAIRGDVSEPEEDIDDVEAKLEEKGEEIEKDSSESEEEEQEVVDKPRKRNPMVDDEAEESDCDDVEEQEGEDQEDAEEQETKENEEDDGNDADNDEDDDSDESSEESESENEEKKPKKGRILKAFEDSDDEDVSKVDTIKDIENADSQKKENIKITERKDTQDDEIQLAQMHKSLSDDLFTSQASTVIPANDEKPTGKVIENTQDQDKDFETQTFSILDSSVKETLNLPLPDKMNLCGSQGYDDNLDAVVGMCSGSFSQSQNIVTPTQCSNMPESQVIGDDVLALCTGKFYDNQFISQADNNDDSVSQGEGLDRPSENNFQSTDFANKGNTCESVTEPMGDVRNIIEPKEYPDEHQLEIIDQCNDGNIGRENKSEDTNLRSILDELHDAEFDTPRSNKYFVGDKENNADHANIPVKKKFVIDSDDEAHEEATTEKKRKKLKKKKLEKRALQISDDEEEASGQQEAEELESDIEEDEDKLFEYDSEENEITIQPQNPKKKRKMAEFFENEAELTSEDEWVGSGDEDEAGLDRMEREAGDDETFNQNKLQRELGQIHMRDVLDQDKREVRLIQELLFEDGDLGGGHRQRKFRWRDAGDDEETGMPYSELTDTQEEEFESEEQWRKQRHEREMFLKQLKEQEQPEEALNVSVNRTTLIKASLAKNTSNLFAEVNTSIETEIPVVEKKTAKDIPSPKKPFTIFQQNYHGSLLTRGRGALARLAALATPLTTDDDTPNVGSLAPSSKRNFVFAALDKEKEEEPKVNKRKAETNVGTPRLVKKLRTQENQKFPKSSLLDHLKT